MFCKNFLSLTDCLITSKSEGRVIGDLDVGIFLLIVIEVLKEWKTNWS